MKSTTIPSLRVEPELRRAAENVLRNGETLSSFMEESLREGIRRRMTQRLFVERGLASRDEARRSGEYFSAEDILTDLDNILKGSEGIDER